jgi:hypothetical protein
LRVPIVVVAAVTFALVGPRLTGARAKAANTPFVYEPPEGFVDTPSRTEGAKAWVFKETGLTGAAVNETHSTKELPVEETELAKLVHEMPSAFEDCSWSHRRHEMRLRPDGARVGLIEGDCNKEVDLSVFGGQKQKIKQRKLQLMFPEDTGTAIVTASYPTDEASRWEPMFEATIARARGVATRVPPIAPWLYGAWGSAGAILGWLLAALIKRKDDAPAKEPKKAQERLAKAEIEEEEDEDESPLPKN